LGVTEVHPAMVSLHFLQHHTVLQVPQTKCPVNQASHHPTSIGENCDSSDTTIMFSKHSTSAGDWNDYVGHLGGVDSAGSVANGIVVLQVRVLHRFYSASHPQVASCCVRRPSHGVSYTRYRVIDVCLASLHQSPPICHIHTTQPVRLVIPTVPL